MKYSTSASGQVAATNHRRSSRKANANHIFGSAAVACLVLGCAWTLHANVFGASIYPSIAVGNFDAPLIRLPQAATARHSQAVVDNVFAEFSEPAPVVAAPASFVSGNTLRFEDRFAASAAQAVDPAPQAETMKLASAAPVEAAKPKPAAAQTAPARVAALAPVSPPASAETKPARTAGASVKDMAQRAKAAVMSIASADQPSIFEKLYGMPKQHSAGLLAYASADASATGSLGPSQNAVIAGAQPRYDRQTAVYDITARTVYLPNGTRLEAHSGLGGKMDDPKYAHVRMQGVTPPHVYELTPRESLFHGVPALRLNPVGGSEAIFGRDGLLAHTYMLGTRGDSNGCVSFKDYYAFLQAYRNGEIKRLAVVARVD